MKLVRMRTSLRQRRRSPVVHRPVVRSRVRPNTTVENHEMTVGYGAGKRWPYEREVFDIRKPSKRAEIMDTLRRVAKRSMGRNKHGNQ